MPELPEVELARRQLARWAQGKKVAAVRAAKTRVVDAGITKIVGAKLVGTHRRGKNIVGELVKGRQRFGLHVHLGMTGKLLRRKKGEPDPRFSRVAFELSDGRVVHYCDMRLFGRIEAGPFEKVAQKAFGHLGPDPLVDRFTPEVLAERIGKRHAPIKVVLLDQGVVAGVGNIYAVEALWRAGIHPKRPADRLKANDFDRLVKGILESFQASLEEEGDTDEITYVEEDASSNPFAVYEREGELCRRCRKGRIRRAVMGGRSTYWCPQCQKT